MRNALIKVDLFKLIVLIILIIVLIILVCEEPAEIMSREMAGEADTQQFAENNFKGESSVAQIPSIPKSDDSLKLNEVNMGLLDTGGVLRYRLSEDKKTWVPQIPEDILDALPDDFELTSDESNIWHILDGSDGVLYAFNSDVLEWNMAPEKIMEAQDDSRSGDIPVCEDAKIARLTSVGSQVKVVNALIPLRSSPDAESANCMLSLPKGTHLEVVSFPVCTRFLDGANLWWGVRTESGLEGWAAEASAISDVYYLQEIK